jgi:hypothetical protein
MTRWQALAALVTAVLVAPASAADISGRYVEARNCDVWAAPCFANAEMNLGGKCGLMAWKVEKGTLADVNLEGLSVAAVISTTDTLGLQQTGTAKAVLIVDRKASPAQREALIRLARRQGGDLLRNVIAVEIAPIDLTVGACEGGACASLQAGSVKLETRCVDAKHDKTCGNESAFYPPLARDVTARAAVALEYSFRSKILNQTLKEVDRRGAYVGEFVAR